MLFSLGSILLYCQFYHFQVFGFRFSSNTLKYGNVLLKMVTSPIEVTTYVPIEILDPNIGRCASIPYQIHEDKFNCVFSLARKLY